MTGWSLDDVIVVAVGECHMCLKQGYDIYKIIKKYRPMYVWCEGFNKENISSFLKNPVERSLRELSIKYKVDLSDILTEDTLSRKKLKELLLEEIKAIDPSTGCGKIYMHNTIIDLRKFPKMTYQDIINMSSAALPPAVLNYTIKMLEEKSKELERDLIGNILDILHINDIKSILTRAKSVSLHFRVLHDVRSRGYMITSAAKRVGAKIGVLDTDQNTEHAKYEKLLEGKISWEDYITSREKLIADSIEKYVEQAKEYVRKEGQTNASIVAIMGWGHVRNVAEILEDRGIGCKVIELDSSIRDPELYRLMEAAYQIYLMKPIIYKSYILSSLKYKYKLITLPVLTKVNEEDDIKRIEDIIYWKHSNEEGLYTSTFSKYFAEMNIKDIKSIKDLIHKYLSRYVYWKGEEKKNLFS